MSGVPHTMGGPSLARRFLATARDPAMLSNPPVAATFCVLRYFGLIAPLPYWALVALVMVGGTVAITSTTLLGTHRDDRSMRLHTLISTGVVGLVAYATGWGPILSIGFVFAAGAALPLFGAKAAPWIMRWTVMWMFLGQLAIALGWAPSLIRAPLVHGLAGLSLLGTLLTTSLVGRVSAEREQVAAELRQSESRFKALVSNASDIIMVVGVDGLLQYVSPAFERVLGFSADPYQERSTGQLIHPHDLERVNGEMASLEAGSTLVTQLRIRDASGRWRHFEASVANRVDDPDVGGIVGNLHDNTDLLEAHERFRSAFDDAPTGMAVLGLDGVIQRANRACGHILGRDAEALVGCRLVDLVHPEERDAAAAEIRRIAEGDGDGYELEQRLCHSAGREVWALTHVSCVRNAVSEPLYLICQVQDVTEQHSMRERLAHAAIHDPLTGLPNRVLFMDRLTMALSRAERSGHKVAVAFLDLDRFKLVNDGLGHSAGDELLQAVAGRLVRAVRTEDTVARFGGDEFTVLWEDLDSDADAMVVARRVLDALQQAFELEGAPVFVTASIGVAVADDESSPVSMLRDADTAMYLAKEAGRGRVEIFDGTSHAKALENLNVINRLHSALADEEFRLHYQPIVDLATGRVMAVEALVRWQHPERGLLSPSQFIAVAEECGLIVDLGKWVLRQACAQAAGWNVTLGAAGLRPVEMHVNISPRQLASDGFVTTVKQTLAECDMVPETLCLEITEGTLMGDEAQATGVLDAVRALGVHISVDDFGTGYSSLSYLKHFPIDSLKVDRTFVDGLGEDPDDSLIVSAVVALAHSLGLIAVAEGVETEIALDELRRLGCDRVQGYLVGRPESAAEFERQLLQPIRVPPPELSHAAAGLVT